MLKEPLAPAVRRTTQQDVRSLISRDCGIGVLLTYDIAIMSGAIFSSNVNSATTPAQVGFAMTTPSSPRLPGPSLGGWPVTSWAPEDHCSGPQLCLRSRPPRHAFPGT
jgi:hypothetical protein